MTSFFVFDEKCFEVLFGPCEDIHLSVLMFIGLSVRVLDVYCYWIECNDWRIRFC